ncbi:MAG TPA: trypsin-like peptidase domain-containing protein [Vicinamibacteria bacterium]|nr:trypsin-like peptidase domain-containing protein [Vicinamibacteria bacterium]
MSTRAALLAAGALSLAIGLAAGARLSRRLEPAARAAAPPAPAPAAPALLGGPDFTVIARRATPAVVNISALQVYRTQRSPFFSDPFFREFFGRDSPFRIPSEERKTSLGSGVIIGADGVIVTNNHVIERARQIAITTSDRRRLRARLVGSDPVTDIAVVKVEAQGLPTLSWGDSSRVQVGEYVVAIGNPFQLNQTVTMGIVSATGRSNVGIVDYEDFIQTDAAINPGNSGGALVDTRGQLIGINTAIYSETGGYQGIGFAVPANIARAVVKDLLAHGRVVRGWTGITRIADVGQETGFEQPAGGAVVVEMLRRSPAERAGILPGDVVVEVDGRPVESAAQLRNELARAAVGSTLRLTLLREGRRREVSLEVEEASDGA